MLLRSGRQPRRRERVHRVRGDSSRTSRARTNAKPAKVQEEGEVNDERLVARHRLWFPAEGWTASASPAASRDRVERGHLGVCLLFRRRPALPPVA